MPNWSVARLIDERPELRDQPLVVYERVSGGRRVRVVSAVAAEQGVRAGMPVAEAAALCGRRLMLVEHDPPADRARLMELAAWCEQFSPTVGIESVAGNDPQAAPECVVMDITGVQQLFGGEGALARLVVRRFARRNLHVRVAVADTIGAAWAVVRYGQSCHCLRDAGKRVNSIENVNGVCQAVPGSVHSTEYSVPSTRYSVCRTRRAPYIIPSSHCLTDAISPDESRQNLNSVCQAVARLPLPALRLPQTTIELLQSLGLTTIDQVTALPRSSLTARFGPQLLARLDELSGTKAETIEAARPASPFEAEFQFPYPTHRTEAIDDVIHRLLCQLCQELQAQRQGALSLLCRIWLEDGRQLHLSVGLYRTTTRVKHLAELIQLQWEQQRLSEPVATIRLTVTASGPLEVEQQELFVKDDDAERTASPRDRRRLAMLLDRLSSRLGRDTVLRVRLIRDAVPEQACRLKPLTLMASGGRAPSRSRPRLHHGASRPPARQLFNARPLSLLPCPQPVTVMAVAPDGPPAQLRYDGTEEKIIEAIGPERIETGWWRGPSIRRDYYRVATTSGARLWLFRRREDGRWFVHGEFD